MAISPDDPKKRFADVGIIDPDQSQEASPDPSAAVVSGDPNSGLQPGRHDISKKSKDVLAKYISQKTVDPATKNEYTLSPDPSLPTSIARVNGQTPALGTETNTDRHLSKSDVENRLGYESAHFGKLQNPGPGKPVANLDSELLKSDVSNLEPYVTDVITVNDFKKETPAIGNINQYDLRQDSQVTDLNQITPEQKVHAGKILSKNNLASYISEKTGEAQSRNDYKVPPGSLPTKIYRAPGTAATPSLNASTNNNQHLLASETDNKLSYKSQEYTFLGGAGIYGSENEGKNGNTLLKSEDVTQKLKPYTSAVLKKNRFYPSTNGPKNPYSSAGEQPPAFFTKDHKNQEVSDSDQVIQLLAKAADSRREVSTRELGFIGKILMLRATGEIDTEDKDYNPNENAGALLPGVTQMAIERVYMNLLEARDITSTRRDDNLPPGSDSPGPNEKSWGSMNNHLEPFSGIMPLGMIALSLALILAAQITLRLLNAIFAMLNNPNTIKYDQHGIRPSGKYDFNPNTDSDQFGGFSFGGISNLNSLLNMPATQNPFPAAVNKGLEVFFRASPDGGSSFGSNLKGGFQAAFESPGYYAIFVRAIARSAVLIADEIKNVTKNPNPVAIAQAIINLIDVLRSSKIFSSVRIFAYLGDTELNRGQGIGEWEQDLLPDGVPHNFKNRKKNSRLLAWRQSDLPSTYLLPSSVQIASQAAKHFGNAGIESFFDPAIYSVKPNLDKTDVIEIENKLEAEYVPFYFQDLRSKEIIAFPAFITSMNDEFNVNWESTEGYGRVDPVKVYKSTHRRISVSFKVVSLDPKDFDSMWVKINKLVTMVYPQYSKGATYAGNNGKTAFIQPFSQIIKSSPVIRLRLGDVWKTNYSKFALARLFGLGQKDDNGKNILAPEDISDASLISFNKTLNEIRDGLNGDNKKFAETLNNKANKNNLSIKLRAGKEYKIAASVPGGLAAAAMALVGAGSKGRSYTERLLQSYEINELKLRKDEYFEVTLKDYPPAKQEDKPKGPALPSLSDALSSNSDKNVKLLVSRDDLVITIIGKAKTAVSNDDTLKNFFSKDNAIVKSFEESGGRGLACTIDSLSFNWFDSRWETGEINSRAPMGCDITLSLTPIHDISPGLDSDNFNRAPVYNVGNIMKYSAGTTETVGDKSVSYDTKLIESINNAADAKKRTNK